jgi:uncharacterized protein involved in exopolysaccharide biosynthesis
MLAEERRDPQPYLRAFARRWRVIGAVFAITVLTAAGLIFLIVPPTYQARAGVFLIKARSEINFDPKFRTLSAGSPGESAGPQDRQAQQKALVGLARSTALASEVIREVGDRLQPEKRKPDRLQQAIQVVDQGDLIEIVAEADTPDNAVAVANAWAGAFEKKANSLYGVTRPAEAIRAQWVAARQRYEEAEAALAAFAADNQMTSLTLALSHQKGWLVDAYATQQRIERALGDATMLRTQLGDANGAAPASTQAALADLLLRAQATTLASELPAPNSGGTATPASSTGSPATQLQLAIDQSTGQSVPLDQLAAQLDLLIAALESRWAQLGTAIASPAVQAELLRLDEQLQREQARERQLKTARDVASETYVTLSRTMAEAEVAEQVGSETVTLAVLATPPDRPAWPNKPLSLAIAAALGVILGCAAALAVDRVDPRRLDVTAAPPMPARADALRP